MEMLLQVLDLRLKSGFPLRAALAVLEPFPHDPVFPMASALPTRLGGKEGRGKKKEKEKPGTRRKKEELIFNRRSHLSALALQKPFPA